jgi:hypothetical protein
LGSRSAGKRDEFCRRCLQNVALTYIIVAIPKPQPHTAHQALLGGKAQLLVGGIFYAVLQYAISYDQVMT